MLSWVLHQFSSVSQSCLTLCEPTTAARQASLSINNSQSLLKLMSIELVMPSSHLIFCRPVILLPPIPPSIRVFSNESALCMKWPKYWSFSFNISPSNEHPGLISFRMDWLDHLAVQGLSRVFNNTIVESNKRGRWSPKAQPLGRNGSCRSTSASVPCIFCEAKWPSLVILSMCTIYEPKFHSCVHITKKFSCTSLILRWTRYEFKRSHWFISNF